MGAGNNCTWGSQAHSFAPHWVPHINNTQEWPTQSNNSDASNLKHLHKILLHPHTSLASLQCITWLHLFLASSLISLLFQNLWDYSYTHIRLIYNLASYNIHIFLSPTGYGVTLFFGYTNINFKEYYIN